MNDTARITSFEQLANLKSKIEVVEAANTETPQVSVDFVKKPQQPRKHRDVNDTSNVSRHFAPGYQKTENFHQQQFHQMNEQQPQANPKWQPRVNRPNRPDVNEIVQVIQNRVRVPVAANHVEKVFPTLEEFIMMLQGHTFSFIMNKNNQLPKFIKAQEQENRFYQIAWTGGDEYMTALMLYQNYTVQELIEKGIQRFVIAQARLVEQGRAVQPSVAPRAMASADNEPAQASETDNQTSDVASTSELG